MSNPVGPVAIAWLPSYRVVHARYAPVIHFERFATAADVALNLELASYSDATAGRLLNTYRLLPNEDRLSGPGAGLLMPSFVFPAWPARFSSGRTGGTYYAAHDEETALAETLYHFAYLYDSAPDALRKMQAAGQRPREPQQMIAADVYGPFLDVRQVSNPAGVGDIYSATGDHDADYAAGQRLEARVRPASTVDGILYRSVRHRAADAECVAVYRPRALRNGRVVSHFTYEWQSTGVAVAVSR